MRARRDGDLTASFDARSAVLDEHALDVDALEEELVAVTVVDAVEEDGAAEFGVDDVDVAGGQAAHDAGEARDRHQVEPGGGPGVSGASGASGAADQKTRDGSREGRRWFGRREREQRDEAVGVRPGVPGLYGRDEPPDQKRRGELHADKERHAQNGQDQRGAVGAGEREKRPEQGETSD